MDAVQGQAAVAIVASLLLVFGAVSVILVGVSAVSDEPVIPRTAFKGKVSQTPLEALPPAAAPAPDPVPRRARHPTPKPSAHSSGRVIRSPTSPRQFRTTRPVTGGKRNKLYLYNQVDQSRVHMLPDVSEPVIDVAYFRRGLLVLLNYGNMIYLTQEDGVPIENQLPATPVTLNIVQLAPFGSEVVGMSDEGTLHVFQFRDVDAYGWQRILPSVDSASYICGTDVGDVLWVQTGSRGVAYDATGDIVDRQDYTHDVVRIYGTDCNEFIEIDRGSQVGTMRSSGGTRTMDDVYIGAWCNHEFVRISYNNFLEGIKQVRCIAGLLYYVVER